MAPFQAEAKATRLLIIIIVVLHAGLALTFQVMFFSYYVVKLGPDVTIPGTGPIGSGNSTTTVTSAIHTSTS
jgi:protein YIPF1/2